MTVEKTFVQAGRWTIGALVMTMIVLASACGGRSEAPEQQAADPVMPPSVPETALVAEAQEAEAARREAEEIVDGAAMMDDGLVAASAADEPKMTEEEFEQIMSEWLHDLDTGGIDQTAPEGLITTLPEDFPIDVILPDDLEIRAVQISTADDSTMVQGSSPQPLNTLTEFFLRHAHANNWAIGSQSEHGGALEKMRIIRLTKEERTVELVMIATDRFDETLITLTLREQ